MVNVAAPLLPQAARKLGRKSTAEYYASGSEYAVRKARSILDRAGVAYSEAFPLGDAAEEVTRLAEKHDIDLVVMGSRGQTALKRSEEHTSELQSLMRISYAVFCVKKIQPMTTIRTPMLISVTHSMH